MTTTHAPVPHELNRLWADAFNAGDLPRMMTMYEPDALLVPGPDAEPIRGHDAIAAAMQGFLALGGRLDFTPRMWLQQGDLVYGSVAFDMVGGHDPDGRPVVLTGVTAEVLRRQPDGSWKYVIDHPFGGSV